ncbi:MAG: flagellar biosynthesis protein FliQ [Candidimonas sp.]|jgi:flagellar biosynthetic protein FliQ|nr:MAG: flagellar biosynthesis protein FliQ [Candidimonas sp.]
MTSTQVMTLTYTALKLAFELGAPLLFATLIVGLVISIFQAATQINEMTLSFIPKLLATGIVLVFAGPWMLHSLTDFLRTLLLSIPQLAS